jgi:hypothetical protein
MSGAFRCPDPQGVLISHEGFVVEYFGLLQEDGVAMGSFIHRR